MVLFTPAKLFFSFQPGVERKLANTRQMAEESKGDDGGHGFNMVRAWGGSGLGGPIIVSAFILIIILRCC